MASTQSTATFKLTEHLSTPYICLSASLPMSQLSSLASKIAPLFAFLSSSDKSLTPAGAPFFKYVTVPVGMGGQQPADMEVGLPVSADFQMPKVSPADADAGAQDDIAKHVQLKYLPAGTYLETTHVGPPSGLQGATKGLLEHAEREGLEFDLHNDPARKGKVASAGGGNEKRQQEEFWGARLEWYESDPKVVDMKEWRTRLSFKLK